MKPDRMAAARLRRAARTAACVLAAALLLLAPPSRAQATDAPACPPAPAAPNAQQLQAAQAQARDRGVLWRVRRDGLTHHLYGTVHVGKLEWAFPGPKVGAALADAQALVFELDPMDPAVQTALRRPGAAAAPLPPALQAQLARRLARACLPVQALAGLHPMMQAITAMMVEASRDGLHAAWGQEFVLAAAARARNLPRHSLETAERQLAALIPADAAQAERQLASMLAQMDSGRSRQVLLRLAGAWERGVSRSEPRGPGAGKWCARPGTGCTGATAHTAARAIPAQSSAPA